MTDTPVNDPFLDPPTEPTVMIEYVPVPVFNWPGIADAILVGSLFLVSFSMFILALVLAAGAMGLLPA